MNVKMIKFNLPLDDASCKSKEDIAHNFNLPELIDHFKSGRLMLWCRVRKFEQEIKELELLKNKNNKDIAEKLCEIFDVNTDNLIESLMFYEYQNSDISDEQERVKVIFENYMDQYLSFQKERIKLQEEKKKGNDSRDSIQRDCTTESLIRISTDREKQDRRKHKERNDQTSVNSYPVECE